MTQAFFVAERPNLVKKSFDPAVWGGVWRGRFASDEAGLPYRVEMFCFDANRLACHVAGLCSFMKTLRSNA